MRVLDAAYSTVPELPAAAPAPITDATGDVDLRWMREALALAESARDALGEVPVGALLVDAQGQCIGRGMNRTISDHDPSAHAEIVALRAAGQAAANYRLPGSTLYVTLEPCAMCAMALVHARVARVVYAADDPKTGAVHSVFELLQSAHHNHRIEVTAGVLAEDCGSLLREFFRARRGRKPALASENPSP